MNFIKDKFTIIKKDLFVLYQEQLYSKVGNLISIERNVAKIKLNNSYLFLERIDPFLFKEKESQDNYLIYGSEVYKKDEIQNQSLKIEIENNLQQDFSFSKTHRLINSENLLGLQRLKQYKNKIDCIIIDPPYNTQNKTMKYNDVFLSNEWVEFMKNRLIQAKNLLSEEGVIFIHINDKEYARLRLLIDEIFKEDNFIENFIWQKNSIKNNSKTTSNNHEYILCFAKNKPIVEKLNYFKVKKDGLEELLSLRKDFLIKNKNKLEINSNQQKEELIKELEKEIKKFFKENKQLKGISQYKFVDENFEIFRISDVSAPNKKGMFYDILHPITKKICKNPQGGYRYNEETIKELLDKNLLYFGKNENTVPQFKRYLKDVEFEVCKSVIVTFDEGYNDLKNIVPNADFNNPKPVSLIKHLIRMINKKEFFVLDFFAGSGTIIQATEEVNQEDHKKITCLAITSNENNICNEITKTRFEKVLLNKGEFIYEI